MLVAFVFNISFFTLRRILLEWYGIHIHTNICEIIKFFFAKKKLNKTLQHSFTTYLPPFYSLLPKNGMKSKHKIHKNKQITYQHYTPFSCLQRKTINFVKWYTFQSIFGDFQQSNFLNKHFLPFCKKKKQYYYYFNWNRKKEIMQNFKMRSFPSLNVRVIIDLGER